MELESLIVGLLRWPGFHRRGCIQVVASRERAQGGIFERRLNQKVDTHNRDWRSPLNVLDPFPC